jgi:hypothetical protein
MEGLGQIALSIEVLLVTGTIALFIGLQLLVGIAILIGSRAAARERHLLHKEMYGLVKRIEGLTANRREQILKHYDEMLEHLATRLPPTIAAHTSNAIIETESKILQRLAELEPSLGNDESSRRKMDELIRSMEGLEKTIVALAADTVQRVMAEGRRSLIEAGSSDDFSLAA